MNEGLASFCLRPIIFVCATRQSRAFYELVMQGGHV